MTMSKLNKLTCIVMIFLMLVQCFALISCNDTDVPDDEISSSSDNDSESETKPEEPPVSLAGKMLSKYYFVRSDSVESEPFFNSMLNLKSLLEEKTGQKTKGIVTDFIIEGSDYYKENEFEIIIGDTKRKESKDFLSTLKYKDYGYGVVGDKIVIAGNNDAETILAIDKFIEEVVEKYDESSDSFSIKNSSIFKYDYKFDTFSINGADISEYSIAYTATKSKLESNIARDLQEYIGCVCGIKLDIYLSPIEVPTSRKLVITDYKTLSDKIRREKDLLVAESNKGINGYIIADESNVWFWSETLSNLLGAVDAFKNIVNESTSPDITIKSAAHEVSNQQIKVMTFNVFVGQASSRRNLVRATIFNQMPDVLGVQEATNNWMSMLRSDLGDIYACVGMGRDTGSVADPNVSSGEHTAIFYNKEKYELIETDTFWLSDTPDVYSKYPSSKYYRIMTYAILERKTDGYRFMHVNTHLDFEGANHLQAQKMIELIDEIGFDGMTFVTGDFNCIPSDRAYKIMYEAGFYDASDIANYAMPGPTGSAPGATRMIDYCFFRDPKHKLNVETHVIVRDTIDGKAPSDHCPVYATVIPTID